jgi:hypothetical protein
METSKPFTWVLSALNAKDLTGFTQDGMEWKLARGEEYVIYKQDDTRPGQSYMCMDPNTINDSYQGLVILCQDDGMKVYLHVRKGSVSANEFRWYTYYPITQNIVVEFDAVQIAGNSQIGLVVGGGNPKNVSTDYLISLKKGTFDVEKCAHSLCNVIFGDKKLGVNPVIKPLADGNHFMIKIIKGKLYFYINDVLQAQLSNEKIPYTYFGFVSLVDNVVMYKNMVVRIPSQSEINLAQ